MPVPFQYVESNPWWRDDEAIEQDRDLRKLSESTIKWEQRLRFYFRLRTDVIYTLRGPRQIGKTTLLKRFVQDLLKGYIEPLSL